MKAREIMTNDHLWVCSPDTTIRQAAQMMSEHDIGSVPIVDAEGHLQGILTDRDICCRVVAKGRSFDTPVQDIMSMPVHTIAADAELGEIESVIREYQVRRLPVVDERQRLCGVVSVADLARHCRSLFREHGLAETLEAVSSTAPVMERV
jgi:CBS domain-containing protein